MQHVELRQKLSLLFKNRPYLRSAFYVLIDVLVVSFWHMRRGILSFARVHTGPVHLLDAGTGLGQYVYFLSRKFPTWNIYATDVSMREICECNRFFNRMKYDRVLFRTEDMLELNRQAVYDMILAVNVIEYIEEDTKVLNNFFNALKPGGMLLVSVQSDKSKVIQPNFTNKLLGNEAVVHRYGNLDLKKKLKEIGFKNLKAHYAYGTSGRISTYIGVSLPKRMLSRSKTFLYVMPLYYLFCYPLVFVLNSIDAYFVHLSGSELVVRAYKM